MDTAGACLGCGRGCGIHDWHFCCLVHICEVDHPGILTRGRMCVYLAGVLPGGGEGALPSASSADTRAAKPTVSDRSTAAKVPLEALRASGVLGRVSGSESAGGGGRIVSLGSHCMIAPPSSSWS